MLFIKIIFYGIFAIFFLSKITGACEGKNCNESDLVYDLLQIFSLCIFISISNLITEFMYILLFIVCTVLIKIILKRIFGKKLEKINEKIKKCKKQGTCFDPWKKGRENE